MNYKKLSLLPLPDQDLEQITHNRVELIEELLSIGTALSSSRDLNKLLNLILSKSREITFSDAGSVYLIDKTEQDNKLLFKVAQNDSLDNFSFQEFSLPLTTKSLAGYVAITGETLNIPDAYQLDPSLPYQLDQSFDRNFSYRTRSVLVLPMRDQNGQIIGVLQLINRKIAPDLKIVANNAYDYTQCYSEFEQRILISLASQAAISIERNMLHESIENLFEGFVKASVQAIEARDPTTSGHSERVAELTVGLIKEVNLVDFGCLRDLYFNQQQIREVRYAALLHDFGKIGVPEAVLTKSKKLYPDNLEIIRQRFAVMRRTLERNCAEQKFSYLLHHSDHNHDNFNHFGCPHCENLGKFERDLAQAIEKLDFYWKLIEAFNEPLAYKTKEFLDTIQEVSVELANLSSYTYQDVDGQIKPLVTKAEMEQLMLPRGNLTPEEREAIESHVTKSFEFLRQIPWTQPLQEVPIIAYGHHEKIDGTGYPLGLKGDQIPFQSQVMAIADIYDALTAADRPYKKSLSLSIALKILREEAGNNKLNQELVLLFEQREVFQVLGHFFNEQ
jgi:HD-GYP domain-containing protein (c-di-GMP phosphodiesterase class II)